MRWSIRYQLLIPLLLLLVSIAGISTWTALSSARRARNQIENQVRNVVRTLNDSNLAVAPNWLAEMRGLSGAEYLLVDNEGRETKTFGLTAEPGELPRPVTVVEDGQNLQLSARTEVANISYLCCGVRLRRPEGATLYIFYPENLWRDALWEAIRPSVILGGFMGLGSLILAIAVASTFGRRIQQLKKRTQLIAAGDFSPMPLPTRNDELRDLGQSINEMAQQLARLQETVEKSERLKLLGQVSGGLAHQLRNEVTGARLALQLHAREINGHADPEPIEVALRQLSLMETNLQRFLQLGKTDPQTSEPTSLTTVLDEAVRLLIPKSRHANIELIWDKPNRSFLVEGNSGQLSQLFLNLISNALEAAGPGGRVEVRILPIEKGAGTSTWCRVEMIDSGPGLPANIADHLFEPFVTGKPDGVGLGLPLARQVAEAHGGRIGWTRIGQQTLFFVELPLQGVAKETTMEKQVPGE